MGRYRDQVQTDIKAAMRAGDRPRLQVLRMLLAALKDAAEAAGGAGLDDAAEEAILRKAVKSRSESVAQAREVGRQDVADAESAEIALIEAYLPQMLTGDELAAKVRELAAEIGYAGPQDTGRFMKEWMSRHAGRADGREVQAALKAL